MRHSLRPALLMLALLWPSLHLLHAATPQLEELDRIVAVVNEDIITLSELELRTRQIIQQFFQHIAIEYR